MARLSVGAEERGQLLLVGAFALAVLLVALAVVLNGAATTEALATSGGDTSATADALGFQRAVEDGVSGLIVSVNRNNGTSHAALDAALDETVADWEDTAQRGNAEAGVGITVEVTGRDDGSRIAQETPRNFTDVNATTDWTLATNVTDSRGLAMNVSRASLATSCLPSCFRVTATDGTDTWEAQVTNTSNAITVTVSNATDSTTCSVVAESARIDLSAGELAGSPCDWPTFEDSFSDKYDVRYRSGELANGTYEWVLDEADIDTTHYGPGGPTVSPAIYTATVEATYRTPSVTYTVAVTVDPGAD